MNGIDIPIELLLTDTTYTKNDDNICKMRCPQLTDKIIAAVDGQIIRQSKRNVPTVKKLNDINICHEQLKFI